jgi:hypothetical protein
LVSYALFEGIGANSTERAASAFATGLAFTVRNTETGAGEADGQGILATTTGTATPVVATLRSIAGQARIAATALEALKNLFADRAVICKTPIQLLMRRAALQAFIALYQVARLKAALIDDAVAIDDRVDTFPLDAGVARAEEIVVTVATLPSTPVVAAFPVTTLGRAYVLLICKISDLGICLKLFCAVEEFGPKVNCLGQVSRDQVEDQLCVRVFEAGCLVRIDGGSVPHRTTGTVTIDTSCCGCCDHQRQAKIGQASMSHSTVSQPAQKLNCKVSPLPSAEIIGAKIGVVPAVSPLVALPTSERIQIAEAIRPAPPTPQRT